MTTVSPVAIPLRARVVVPILALLLIVTVVLFGAVLLGLSFIPGARAVIVPVLAIALITHPTAMLVTLHAGLRRAGIGWREIGLLRPTARMLHLGWQIPAILVLLLLVQALALLITGEATTGGGSAGSLMSDASPVLVVLISVGVVVVTPLWEELAFRGLVHGGLRRRWGPIVASSISAAVFAACHGVPVLLPYMVTLGLSLACLREFHRTLWAPLIMHVVVNGLATGIALVAIQG